MMKQLRIFILLFTVISLTIQAGVIVNCDAVIGPIKPMNGVNNGFMYGRKDNRWHNEGVWKDAHISYMRPHDATHRGPHSVDISGIFPDFSKDPDKAENYDFTLTDIGLSRKSSST